jgi:hypothetical protein
MNIREITGRNPNYFEIAREERNYAAILFAALCMPGNAKRFLQMLDPAKEIGPEFGIYFEYAYLRDLWSKISGDEPKKDVIRELLPIKGIDQIVQLEPEEINRKFGVAGKPSSGAIQFPGNWSIGKFAKNFHDDEDFLKICRFKWSFRIKPDLVIHLEKNAAICIEAKHESKEGSYPSKSSEKSIFKERGLDHVGQAELQKYMMEDLIGIETDFILLVSDQTESQTHKVVTWNEAFAGLEMAGMPPFAIDMAKRISA